ncbi:MAG: hydrogen peroxide-inducible genes activator [Sphingomonadaceae bacterium]|nr:hydrogen peroxide-inducible genes activator [Sphingomonadaceae bacterium]
MILPTLKQLEYLTALAGAGHFGRAAAVANVTQSTLSAGIAELERLLGVQLVERGARSIRFTPAGEAVLARAHRVLREAEELTAAAKASAKPLSGPLRLGVIPTIAPFLLPRVLPKLRAAYPDLKLYLREETSAAACQALTRGQLDAVLLALPYACGGVDVEPLFDDAFQVAFSEGALDGPPPFVRPDDLAPESLLLLEDGHCLRDQALAACGRPELRADASIVGTSLHTLIQMVDGGLGLTLVPQMAIDAGVLAGTRVQVRPLAAKNAKRVIALIWRSSSPRAAEFRMLAQVLRDVGR